MTMFSMKPKFNLAEFLAEPAKVASTRRRSGPFPARDLKPVEEPETPSAADAPVARPKAS